MTGQVDTDPGVVLAELATVDAQMSRVDTKASVLLGLAGAATTVAISAVPAATGVALTPAVGAVLVFAAATIALITAVRPALKARTPHGFVAYATNPDQVTEHLTAAADAEQRKARLVDLSSSVWRKYRRIRIGVDLMVVGLVLSVAAGLTA